MLVSKCPLSFSDARRRHARAVVGVSVRSRRAHAAMLCASRAPVHSVNGRTPACHSHRAKFKRIVYVCGQVGVAMGISVDARIVAGGARGRRACRPARRRTSRPEALGRVVKTSDARAGKHEPGPLVELLLELSGRPAGIAREDPDARAARRARPGRPRSRRAGSRRVSSTSAPARVAARRSPRGRRPPAAARGRRGGRVSSVVDERRPSAARRPRRSRRGARLRTTPMAPSSPCSPTSTTGAAEVRVVERRAGDEELAAERVHAAHSRPPGRRRAGETREGCYATDA